MVTATISQINPAVLSRQLLALLETIPHDARREEVHRLRTTVRRLEVQLSNCPGKVARSLKALRREAGKVRDIDVHIALLKPALLPTTSGSSEAEPDPMEKLRKILKAKRDRHLGSLRDLLAEATPLLEAKLLPLAEPAKLPPCAHDGRQLTVRTRKRFLQWTRNMPDDPERLHRLRIKTKKLRYSLEPLKGSKESTELAANLKQVQDAIGSWHDWATLQQISEHELNAPGAEPLCAALRARTGREYRKARRAAQTVSNGMTAGKAAEPTAGDNASQRTTRKAG